NHLPGVQSAKKRRDTPHSKRFARPACANYFGAAGAEAALVAGGGGVGASGVSPGRFVKTEVAWLAGATAGALLGAGSAIGCLVGFMSSSWNFVVPPRCSFTCNTARITARRK